MIRVNNASFSYRNAKVLKGVSLRFERGKLYGIIGPNGSGKTTLVKIMSDTTLNYGGEVLIDGKKIKEYKGKDLAKKLSLFPQNRHIPDMNAADYIAYGRFPYHGLNFKLNENDKSAVNYAVSKTATEEFLNRNVNELSFGERQRVYLAQLLAQDSDIALLDEPTNFTDISNKFTVMELLKDMKECGKCVVAVLHDLNLALEYCDEIAVIKDGEIVAVSTPKELVERGIIDSVFNVQCRIVDGEYFFKSKIKK